MSAAAQAAVDAGDDVFLVDDFSERDDAIGYQFRVSTSFAVLDHGLTSAFETDTHKALLTSESLSDKATSETSVRFPAAIWPSKALRCFGFVR